MAAGAATTDSTAELAPANSANGAEQKEQEKKKPPPSLDKDEDADKHREGERKKLRP